MTAKPTKAGLAMLKRFADAEREGRLDSKLQTRGGAYLPDNYLLLGIADGPDAICARNLVKQGFAVMREGSRGHRWLRPTDAGREVISKLMA